MGIFCFLWYNCVGRSPQLLFIRIIMCLGIIYSTFSLHTIYAEAPARGINEYTPQELVSHFANAYQVSEYQMSETIRCESNFNPKAVGDKGHSLGLVQIHMPSHKNITREQAFDTVFSVEYMAKEFKLGHQKIWTCYRLKFGKRS